MSVYDQKLYPILPSAPDGADQVYRLHHIQEIDRFLNSEIVERQRLYKKFHRCELVTSYIEHGLIAASVVTGGGSLAALCTGVGIPLSVGLGALAIGSSITTSITKRALKVFNAKAKKHSDICISAQTILDGITCLISKSIQNDDISPEEFEKIMQEKQRYLTMKHTIRSKTKKLVKEISEVQKKELLELGRQQGRQEVADQLVKPSAIQGVSAM